MVLKIYLSFLCITLFTSSYCQDVNPFSCNEEFNDLVDFKQLSAKIKKKLEDNDLSIDDATRLTMFDAWSKIPGGHIEGNFFHLGNFEECYNIDRGGVYGKYCLGTLHMSVKTEKYFKMLGLNTTKLLKIKQIHQQPRLVDLGKKYTDIRFAICIPSFIKASEITGMLDFTEDFCYSKDTEPALSTGAIVTIAILSVFLAIIVTSTGLDTYFHYTNKISPHELLIAFSFLSNGRKVFSSTTNPDQILCLNGIKAISIMWIVWTHEYHAILNSPLSNSFTIQKFENDPSAMFVLGATVAVDTFFVVGGLVSVYTFLRSMDKRKKFSVVPYYIHRYIRLTPALAILCLIHIYLLNYFGSGPLWKHVDNRVVQKCKEGWWSTLLYITNYVRKGSCMLQTWYLTVDMQLFVLSPLVLLPLAKRPIIGLALLGFLAVVGIIISFGISYGLDMGTIFSHEKYMTEYYTQTYTRYGPYVIGMMLGYFIYQVKKSGWKLNMPSMKRVLIICTLWFVCLTGLVACIYADYDVMVATEPNRWTNSLFIAFNRSAWAVALSGLIFLCVTGSGGPINAFLSLPIFQILNKLSYCMYLIHVQLIIARYSAIKNVYKFSNFVTMQFFCFDVLLTLVLSLILCLAFERPIMIIEKYIFGSQKQKSVSKSLEVEVCRSLLLVEPSSSFNSGADTAPSLVEAIFPIKQSILLANSK